LRGQPIRVGRRPDSGGKLSARASHTHAVRGPAGTERVPTRRMHPAYIMVTVRSKKTAYVYRLKLPTEKNMNVN